jgi:hypothetical protein
MKYISDESERGYVIPTEIFLDTIVFRAKESGNVTNKNNAAIATEISRLVSKFGIANIVFSKEITVNLADGNSIRVDARLIDGMKLFHHGYTLARIFEMAKTIPEWKEELAEVIAKSKDILFVDLGTGKIGLNWGDRTPLDLKNATDRFLELIKERHHSPSDTFFDMLRKFLAETVTDKSFVPSESTKIVAFGTKSMRDQISDQLDQSDGFWESESATGSIFHLMTPTEERNIEAMIGFVWAAFNGLDIDEFRGVFGYGMGDGGHVLANLKDGISLAKEYPSGLKDATKTVAFLQTL